MNFLKVFSVCLFLVFGIGIGIGNAATITVSTTTDELNTNGLCSLREAITNINDGATTYSDCIPTGTYGTSDTINIPTGTYIIATNAYSIANNVSIMGAGAGTTTINGDSRDRVFVIGAYTVSISGVTITGGYKWEGWWSGGGGIYNNGTLTITNSTVSSNSIHGDGTCGGGIYNNGTLTVTNSTISGNVATGWWGCGGGGIYNGGTLTVTNSTISNNTANGRSNHGGGGILNWSTLTVTNSTITGNSLGGWGGGGGIYNNDTLTVFNSIAANQTVGADCAGSITSGGYNLESGTSCGFTGTGDMQNTDPLLGPLQDNGGPTFTHELLDGSPAIDIIPNGVNGCGTTISTDQRGVSRPQPSDGLCDIGALEVANCVQPPSNMVSWWGGDNNALDMVGANNGTLIGDTTYETGKVGQAFSFDGAGDYVTAPTNNLPLGNSPRTITAWINDSGGGNTWGGIFHYGQGDCNGRMFGLGKQSGRLTFWGGCADFVSDLVIPENQWTFVAVIYNGSQITLWVNDQSRTSNHSLNTQNSNLWIGGETINNGSSFRSYYQGLIDEVDIYTRALTDEEITAIYNAGSAGKCRSCVEPPSDMIAWWDGEGDANDIIGTNHGTLQNGVTFATGKVGQAFSLNGSNYVEVPDQPILRPSLFTVDAWVFPTVISGNHNVVFKGDHEYLLQLRNGKVLFGSRSATGAYAEYQGSLSVPVNTWSHVAITHDGITKRIYVNGALDPVTQNQVGHYTINTGTLKIGTHNSISEFFNGSIDEVEIFNRALSADEIAAIYNAGSAGKCVTDTTPAQFTFTDQTDVGLNTVVESNTITVSSINSETFIGITDCTGTNCEYRINSGSWTSTDGTINNGDTVQVRQTSSWSYSATTDLTLNIGPVFDVFSVTTKAVPPGPLADLTGEWYEPLTEKCKEKKEGLVCSIKGKLIIRNIGEIDAQYVVFRFYLSDDDSYGVGDILLKADFMYNVNVGKDYKKSFNLTLPVGMSLEGRYIIVYIDAENATVESDESNNFVVYGEASS